MLLFGDSTPVDRETSLRRAEEFRAKKKPKKAVAELEKVLKLNPSDPGAHAKLGPLLVQIGERKRAVESFRIAADDLDARGFKDKALSLWLQVAQAKVSDLGAWQKVAQFHAARGHKADGVKVLIQAADIQEGKEGRERSVLLLRDVLVLDGRHLDATLKLAPLLAKTGEKEEAKTLLANAASFSAGPALKRVRKAQFSLSPGFGTFWRWVRGK